MEMTHLRIKAFPRRGSVGMKQSTDGVSLEELLVGLALNQALNQSRSTPPPSVDFAFVWSHL